MIEFYDIAWLAIKGANPADLLHALNLSEPITELDWNTGVSEIAGDMWDDVPFSRLYVSPSIQGWVLVIGDWISQTDEVKICKTLSLNYEEVWAFGTQMRMDFWLYLCCKNGQVIRHFEKDGDKIIDTGVPLPPEKKLRKASLLDEEADLDDPENWYGEDIVLGIAATYTLDPNQIKEEWLHNQFGLLAVTDIGRQQGISQRPIQPWKKPGIQ